MGAWAVKMTKALADWLRVFVVMIPNNKILVTYTLPYNLFLYEHFSLQHSPFSTLLRANKQNNTKARLGLGPPRHTSLPCRHLPVDLGPLLL